MVSETPQYQPSDLVRKQEDDNKNMAAVRRYARTKERELWEAQQKQAELQAFKDAYENERLQHEAGKLFEAVGLNPKHVRPYAAWTAEDPPETRWTTASVLRYAREFDLPLQGQA